MNLITRKKGRRFKIVKMKDKDIVIPKVIKRIPVQFENCIYFIEPAAVLYIMKCKDHKKVTVATKNHLYFSDWTLSRFEELLYSHGFTRVHKSYLVNANFVYKMEPYFNGSYHIYLTGDDHVPIPLSRNYAKVLREIIEI